MARQQPPVTASSAPTPTPEAAANLAASPAVVLAGFSALLAGMIHLLVVEPHLNEAWGAGLFFLSLGAAQVLWGAAFLRQPSIMMANLGLVGISLGPSFLYLLTRVYRAPWSTVPGEVDGAGIAALAAQGGVAIGVIIASWSTFRRTIPAVGTAALLLGSGLYFGALAVEDVDWLEESGSVHVHDHGPEPLSLGKDGESLVGTVSYFGPRGAAGISDHCRTIGEANRDCWIAFLEDLLLADGAVVAFDTLDELTLVESEALQYGHPMAHDLGHFAYFAYGRDIQLALGECSYEVFQGCIHGSLQAYFTDLVAAGEPVTKANLANVCAQATSNFETYACVHGVGHGIVIYTDYALDEALDLCALMSTSFDRSSCYGGAYMENVVAYLDSLKPNWVPHHGDTVPEFWVDAEDLSYPCNAVDYAYQGSCWRMQTSLILHFNGGDIRGAAAICDTAGDHLGDCYASVGRDAAARARYSPSALNRDCSYGSEEAQEECVRAYVAGALLSANNLQPAIDLCPKITDKYGAWCAEEVGEQAQNMLGRAEAEAVCSGLEARFQSPCLDGIW